MREVKSFGDRRYKKIWIAALARFEAALHYKGTSPLDTYCSWLKLHLRPLGLRVTYGGEEQEEVNDAIFV